MNDGTKVKICGLMREEDVELCVNAGTDIIGFVVEYPVDVPWNLEQDIQPGISLMRSAV